MEYAVRLEGVCKKFKEEQVLKGITHSFAKGNIHGIVGFNGSGKTVMFKCICGFLRPEEGHIWVNGNEVGKDVDFPTSLGMIIENPGFLPDITVLDTLKKLAAINRAITEKEIRETIQKVGLFPDSPKKVREYSLGMRERLGIAQALMEDPQLLILDEPFNGLDKRGAADVYALLEELRERGKTILLAAHNLANIEKLCDTVCEMDAGMLKQIK